jgi:transcriptional regulator with XRE-family HTH domain
MPTTDASAIRRKIVGVLLQGARLRAGRTKKECADVIGVTPGVLAAYEEGRRDISLPELELLAYFMRAPVSSFLEGEDESLVTLDSPPPGPQVMSLRNRIIGALLREAREQSHTSQKDLAHAMGCTPRRITQYEHGLKPIPLTQLEMAAECLGVTLSNFLDEGIGTVGERELQDRQYDAFKALPEDVRAFVVQPVNATYLRVAMNLAEMPAGAIRRIAEGLLDITY